MQESIAAYPSMQFYNDGLVSRTPRRFTNPEGFNWPGRDPVAFINVNSAVGEQTGNHGTGSFFNTAQTELVANLVQNFERWCNVRQWSIGVLTTYAEQVCSVQDELRNRKLRDAHVSTIDKAQGSENDIIIVSGVRSNSKGHLGFVAASRRLNVAMTRAKRGLYVSL